MENNETMIAIRADVRDELRVVAAIQRKTLKALLEEIVRGYIDSQKGK